jgi:transcriptional regulator with XRE-family HTH domain
MAKVENSYARRSLLALLQRTTAREIAARCDVAPSRVSEWVSGITQPSPTARQRLEHSYGIRSDSWLYAYTARAKP